MHVKPALFTALALFLSLALSAQMPRGDFKVMDFRLLAPDTKVGDRMLNKATVIKQGKDYSSLSPKEWKLEFSPHQGSFNFGEVAPSSPITPPPTAIIELVKLPDYAPEYGGSFALRVRVALSPRYPSLTLKPPYPIRPTPNPLSSSSTAASDDQAWTRFDGKGLIRSVGLVKNLSVAAAGLASRASLILVLEDSKGNPLSADWTFPAYPLAKESKDFFAPFWTFNHLFDVRLYATPQDRHLPFLAVASLSFSSPDIEDARLALIYEHSWLTEREKYERAAEFQRREAAIPTKTIDVLLVGIDAAWE